MRYVLVRLATIATFLSFAAGAMTYAIGAGSGLALIMLVLGPALLLAALIFQALDPDSD